MRCFPHLNVFENVAFGLRLKKMPEKEISHERVQEMLELVNLNGFEQRSIHQLSGGQQQRVAIARSPGQPASACCSWTSRWAPWTSSCAKRCRLELKRIQQSLDITFIYVTHDQEEALTMSDTVVVMKDGNIQQVGTPQDIYNEPKNAFVADFIGESNIVDGVMLRDFLVELRRSCTLTCVDRGFKPNEPVHVVIRPEDVQIVPPSVRHADRPGA